MMDMNFNLIARSFFALPFVKPEDVEAYMLALIGAPEYQQYVAELQPFVEYMYVSNIENFKFILLPQKGSSKEFLVDRRILD